MSNKTKVAVTLCLAGVALAFGRPVDSKSGGDDADGVELVEMAADTVNTAAARVMMVDMVDKTAEK